METVISKSIKIPFNEFAAFLKIHPDKIKGGYVASYGKFVEVYLND